MVSSPFVRILQKHFNFNFCQYRRNQFSRSRIILGIETSCDDTGCAVVDETGNIFGESLYSQNAVHLRYGGINPMVAYELHQENIEVAVNEALGKAGTKPDSIDAIAVTTRPGLLVSLQVGVRYARFLSKTYHKPLIAIHHMEAHALVARMYHNIPFPYLVLLISGGDCLLAVARGVDDFLLLGKTLDNAPGEVMDKAARRMKLRNIPAYSQVSGGHAIELAARKSTNPTSFEFPVPLVRYRDCNFSFSGLKDSLVRKLVVKEEEHDMMGGRVIPEVNDLCAAFQLAITEHLVHRTERALLFCKKKALINNDSALVVSGGVACNDFIFKSLQDLGRKFGHKVYRPPRRVCTDNGVMIAWNGVERLTCPKPFSNIDLRDIDPEAPLGVNILNEVVQADIPTRIPRLNKLYKNYEHILLISIHSKLSNKIYVYSVIEILANYETIFFINLTHNY